MRFDCAIYCCVSSRDAFAILHEVAQGKLIFDGCQFSCYSDATDWIGDTMHDLLGHISHESEPNGQIDFPSGDYIVVTPGHKDSQTMCLVNLEISSLDNNQFLKLIKRYADRLDATYSFADVANVSPVMEWELDSRNSLPSPYWCLHDLYWYNRFSFDLLQILEETIKFPNDVLGLGVVDLGNAIEITVVDGPSKRPYQKQIEDWIASCNVFKRQNRKAKFPRRLQLR